MLDCSACRSFGTAISHTDPGGEVIALDSGGYGKVTISQSVSIIAPPGVYAGISVFAGDNGITVAPGAGVVVLRGLSIAGQGEGIGILINAGVRVFVEDCTVSGMTLHGISVGSNGQVHVRNTVMRYNANAGLVILAAGAPLVHVNDSDVSGNGQDGIVVQSGTLTAARLTIDNNLGNGLFVQPAAAGSANVTIADSTLSSNGSAGIFAYAFNPGSTVRVSVSRSTSMRNASSGFAASSNLGAGTIYFGVSESASLDNYLGNGLFASGANITAVVSNSMFAGNANQDLAQSGGAILRTSGNNALTGRGAGDVSGTLTANPLK